MTGVEKSAILLLGIGEDLAAEVLKHLNHKEVQKVGSTMSHICNVNKDQLEVVIQDFVDESEKHTSLGMGSEDFVRNMLVNALGEDKASGLLNRITTGLGQQGLETLKWMEAPDVLDMIQFEHPQIKAVILTYLDSDQAASLLKQFPEEERVDIALRMASIETVQPSALEELNYIVEKHFAGKKTTTVSEIGGVQCVAEILNFLEGSIEQQVLGGIKEVDADLGEEIQDLMFIFDNFLDVDDRSIQLMLREIPSDTLLLALKGATSDIQEKFFKNMSRRAAELLRDDLGAKGPVRISEVEVAQKEVLAIARRMADEGEIILASKGEEMI